MQVNAPSLMPSERRTGDVLGAHIDALSWNDAMARLLGWAHARESRYVTICNVHVVVSASRDAAYLEIINGSDMATPDGAPVAWMLRGRALQPAAHQWDGCDVGAVRVVVMPEKCGQDALGIKGGRIRQGWE